MKRWMKWMTMGLVIGAAGIAASQEPPPADVAAPAENDDPGLEWTVGFASEIFLFEHDALQQRTDYEFKNWNKWREGDSKGTAWGFLLAVGEKGGDGVFKTRISHGSYQYDLHVEDSTHIIRPSGSEVDMSWFQDTGGNDRSKWGWIVGLRYLGLNIRDDIVEVASATSTNSAVPVGTRVSSSNYGQVNWYMAEGGYFGKYKPFGKKQRIWVQGSFNLMLGEASGPARVGFDNDWVDGVIKESYDENFSLAYGANGRIGFGWSITEQLTIGADYYREWLYSFTSTSSGVVMFPDNDDALYQEVRHGVMGFITYTW